MPSSFYISAAHKSSGKTSLSIGLSAALKHRGLSVQTFKKGPDYIDPLWLSQASGRPCYNLDFFVSGRSYIESQYARYSTQSDISLVEGNMGLYDGISLDGSDSNAAMASLLGLPVILVVDCSGTSRGIAPLLIGYQQFNSEIQFSGVILNKLAGARHEDKICGVINEYTDFRILGGVHRSKDIALTERHLGLIPSNEVSLESEAIIDSLCHAVEQQIDIDNLLSSTQVAEVPKPRSSDIAESFSTPSSVLRIAIAKDRSFGFYYPGDLETFHQIGVELVEFDSENSQTLPQDIDGLFIGGGFPETGLDALSANTALMNSIKSAIENGLPTYAECGGLMYLCESIIVNEKQHPLCGVIPADVKMHAKPQGRGYVCLEKTHRHPWVFNTGDEPEILKAHEFHYSSLENLPEDTQFAYQVTRGQGINGKNDGIIMYNLLASYTHLRQTDQCQWVDEFVNFVKSCQIRTNNTLP